ncbi:pH-signaling protein PalC [Arthroderma uncinatum]|uniref:pH-signaling protein PalC n=1 Tax=Arthroderma uncinatum TaxID=74035 RepID=UPI00144A5D95|nr:pH-signaling protein PalC [Arthroderma uncinatum]KAF3481838.1 pH-signaling protein PalC [Arthroderma uncinatum]
MVFSFTLPTTSHAQFQSFLHSNTHPSLPQAGSTARHGLRAALKKHKRLTPSQRAAHLPHVLIALNEYIPYLFAISRGLSSSSWQDEGGGEEAGKQWNDVEEVDILLRSEIEVEWRPTLSSMSTMRFLRQNAMRGHDSSSLSSSSSRVKGRGLDFEIAFVLSTLAYVLSSLARVKYLTMLYSVTTPTVEQKVAAIQTATKNLLQASSIHSYLATFSPASISAPSNTYTPGGSGAKMIQIPVPDLDPSTQSALSSLALAEATLLAVLKDDAYMSACIQSRNKHDTEWMVKAPDIPKVRTLLFARLCVRAAEYAEQAAASVGMVQKGNASAVSSGDSTLERKVDDDLVNYMSILARVSRAKACRFFGIDAEMAGKVGEGIAWLRAARAVLGFKGSTAETGAEGPSKSKLGGFSRLKKEWSERREEKKIEKEAMSSSKGGDLETDIDYGDDAGRDEEGRVIDMLEKKWVRMNDTIMTQLIPSSASYISNLPLGRDIHAQPALYAPPTLDPGQLERLRAPLDPTDDDAEVESSEDEEENDTKRSYY